MPITNKTRIEQFDAIKEDRDMCRLAFYDFANGNFKQTVSLNCADYDKNLKGNKLELSASWRAMPLFLIHWREKDRKTWDPMFMSETHMEHLCSVEYPTTTQRMLRDAYRDLCGSKVASESSAS